MITRATELEGEPPGVDVSRTGAEQSYDMRGCSSEQCRTGAKHTVTVVVVIIMVVVIS